jgi:excisionase family DNA binding protein
MTTRTPTPGEAGSVLSVKDVMRDLQLSKTAVYDAIARQEIPSIRIGRRILIPRAAYQRMLDGQAA